MLTIPGLKVKITGKNKGRGAFATYFKLSPKRGIKVIDVCSEERQILAYTETQLYNSKGWADALHEFNVMKRVEKTKLAAKAFKIVSVYDTKTEQWYPGIIMEHLAGKLFQKSKRSKFTLGAKKTQILCEPDCLNIFLPPELDTIITEVLESCGVVHGDLHDQNVIVCNGTIKILDFGHASIKS